MFHVQKYCSNCSVCSMCTSLFVSCLPPSHWVCSFLHQVKGKVIPFTNSELFSIWRTVLRTAFRALVGVTPLSLFMFYSALCAFPFKFGYCSHYFPFLGQASWLGLHFALIALHLPYTFACSQLSLAKCCHLLS